MVIRKLLELETDETKKNSEEELSGTKKTERPEGKIAIWGAEPTEPTTEPTERVQSMVQSMGRGDVDVSNTVHAAHSRNALEIRYEGVDGYEGYEGFEGFEGDEGHEGHEGDKGDKGVSPYENDNRCVDQLLSYNSSYSLPYNYNN